MTRSGHPSANGNRELLDGYAAGNPIESVIAPLRQIHEAASQFGVFVLDRGGRILTWNPVAEQLWAYTDEQILGRDISCLYSAAETADGQPARTLGSALAHGRYEGQASCRHRDGTTFWAKVVISAVRDTAGNHCGFACLLRDVSAGSDAQRELQSRLRQQEGISKLGARSLEGGALRELMTQA